MRAFDAATEACKQLSIRPRMTQSTQSVYIGIDIGGTALKGGVVTREGVVILRQSAATEAQRGPDAVIEDVAELVAGLTSAATARALRAASVGVGVPGLVSAAEGVVHAAPNLPGWTDVPLRDRLSTRTGLRTSVDNDANNAALGELIAGAGHGVRDMVMLTLGTGVGSGLILGGRLWHGATGHAGEIGHTIVQPGGRACGCGQLGCLEAYASASSTARRAAEAIASGAPSSMKAVIDGGGELDARHVVEAARAGDALAVGIWEDTCRYLAIACIGIQRMLNPQAIVFSGGMSEAGESLLNPLRAAIDRLASKSFGAMPDIRIAELGNDAGFIGSALNEPWHAGAP